jgi:hypothetical protein
MATIVQNNASNDFQAVPLTRTAMTASDTLSYVQGSGQVLFMYNTTASAIPVTIAGSLAGNLQPAGYGGVISLAGGKVVTVPASGSTYLQLDDIAAYLPGTVTLTGGTGITAHLYI